MIDKHFKTGVSKAYIAEALKAELVKAADRQGETTGVSLRVAVRRDFQRRELNRGSL